PPPPPPPLPPRASCEHTSAGLCEMSRTDVLTARWPHHTRTAHPSRDGTMACMAAYTVPSRIETGRLVLRRYETADAEQLAQVIPANIDHLKRFMEWIKFEPQTVEQRREWITRVNTQFDNGED